MTSPTSNNNPSPSASPPYDPFSTPPPPGDTHSIFYSGSSTSTSSGTSADDGEQPCCSYTISASTSNSATASTSATVAAVTRKRKRSSSSSSEGTSEETEQPSGKRTCKRHHLERPQSPATQQNPCLAQARTRSHPSNPHPFVTDPTALKRKINNQFLLKLQRELTEAMQSLDPEDITAAQVWDIITRSAPCIYSRNQPIILFKRHCGSITRLNWERFRRALSLLHIRTPLGPARLGMEAATQATRWLAHFFRSLHSGARPRHRMFGATFTHLCGQALVAQNANIDSSSILPLSSQEHRTCFLNVDDLTTALEHPDTDTTQGESAVVFLRHSDEPLNPDTPLPGCHYPIKDFETEESSPE